MGKYDKDRFQKELAIKFCLSRRMLPFLEVLTPSSVDLSDSQEVLTDLDVAGVELAGDGGLRWSFFDCKSGAKMSAINRAFWAAGVRNYIDYDRVYILLKKRPVNNHRLSALKLNVDLHYEESFRELGKVTAENFANDLMYQSSIDRWEKVFDAYNKYSWSQKTFELSRNSVPLSNAPWTTFRSIIAEMRSNRGQYDPAKAEHLAIFLDLMASVFILWSSVIRDIRRFYEPSMEKSDFEKVLRYYLWGGKENYEIRQKIKALSSDVAGPAELPAWQRLVNYAGVTVSSPDSAFDCAHVCRELSIRATVGCNVDFDELLKSRFSENKRIRQFILGMTAYLVEAGTLPTDMSVLIEDILADF